MCFTTTAMCFMYVIVVAFLGPLAVLTDGAGTTPHLKNIFIGRCWQYQVLSEHSKIDVLKTDVNCTELWEAFTEAFAFKNPCKVNDKSYEKFFNLLHNPKKLKNVS